MREQTIQIYTLKEVHDKFFTGEWKIPPHQRKAAWDNKAFERWGKKLISVSNETDPDKRLLRGCIVVYKLYEHFNFYNVNDGLQRFFYGIKRFKSKYNNWEEVLKKVEITVQVAKYEDLSEALNDFMNINQGTLPTAHEMLKPLFYEAFPTDFEDVWEEKLEKISTIFKTSFDRLGIKSEDRSVTTITNRKTTSKRIRDEMHIFWKYLSQDKSTFSPKVSLQIITENFEKHSELEKKLIRSMKEYTPEEFDKKLDSFKEWINRMTGVYEVCWQESNLLKGGAPTITHFRWWHLACLYLKNNDLQKHIKEFTLLLLQKTKGSSSVYYLKPDSGQSSYSLELSQIKKFHLICREIGFCTPDKIVKKRKKPKVNLKPGYVNSHEKSFSIHGESNTFIEDAHSNLLRSAAPMTEEEKEKLEKLNQI